MTKIELIEKIWKGIWRVGLTFYLLRLGLGGASILLSEKIKDEKQLENILIEESSKLNLNNKKISARFGKASLGTGSSTKLPDGHYKIILDDLGRNRATLKHELYHIYKNQFNHNFFEYFFIDEVQATLYESLNIKL
jgi:regulator of replication initiation timing